MSARARPSEKRAAAAAAASHLAAASLEHTLAQRGQLRPRAGDFHEQQRGLRAAVVVVVLHLPLSRKESCDGKDARVGQLPSVRKQGGEA